MCEGLQAYTVIALIEDAEQYVINHGGKYSIYTNEQYLIEIKPISAAWSSIRDRLLERLAFRKVIRKHFFLTIATFSITFPVNFEPLDFPRAFLQIPSAPPQRKQTFLFPHKDPSHRTSSPYFTRTSVFRYTRCTPVTLCHAGTPYRAPF